MKSEKEILKNYFQSNNITWDFISKLYNLPTMFYQIFKDKIDLQLYSMGNVLSENILKSNLENPKVYLGYSLAHGKYSDDLLIKLIPKLTKENLGNLMINDNLSLNIIEHIIKNKNIPNLIKNRIFTHQKISLDIIKRNEENIDFQMLSQNSNIDLDIINIYKNKIRIDTYFLIHQDKVNDDIVENNINYFNNSSLSSLDLSEEFFSRHYNQINWYAFFSNKKTKISREFVYNHLSKIKSWFQFKNFHLIDENIIQDNINKIDTYCLSTYSEAFSENFIERNIDFFDFNLLLIHRKFSNNFLNKNINEINLYNLRFLKKENQDFVIQNFNNDYKSILEYRFLPESYISNHLNDLNIIKMLYNQNLSENFIKRYYKHLPIYYVLKSQNLSKDLAKQLEINSIF